MTIITVTTPEGRLSREQCRRLAETLTDAVLIPEVGQHSPVARAGLQVHFTERALDAMAIGGKLLLDSSPRPDVMTMNVVVMDATWPATVREAVLQRVLAALAQACDMPRPSPTWWVTFQVIHEGSWGSRGGVLSILDLLESGVFTSDRVAAIRKALE